eukprot:TRINITY_DN3305_c1_g1_i2.p1 TRINITY_DN3305_c1_g1~~TRINITY_DN3305_c1_g1_i2.p1  ORF type:complete len:1154 (-),score=359.07 TRINITY_DN3305_c1_g1_i2:67-3528(-)
MFWRPLLPTEAKFGWARASICMRHVCRIVCVFVCLLQLTAGVRLAEDEQLAGLVVRPDDPLDLVVNAAESDEEEANEDVEEGDSADTVEVEKDASADEDSGADRAAKDDDECLKKKWKSSGWTRGCADSAGFCEDNEWKADMKSCCKETCEGADKAPKDDDECLKKKWKFSGWTKSCADSAGFCEDNEWGADMKSCCKETCEGDDEDDDKEDSDEPAKDADGGGKDSNVQKTLVESLERVLKQAKEAGQKKGGAKKPPPKAGKVGKAPLPGKHTGKKPDDGKQMPDDGKQMPDGGSFSPGSAPWDDGDAAKLIEKIFPREPRWKKDGPQAREEKITKKLQAMLRRQGNVMPDAATVMKLLSDLMKAEELADEKNSTNGTNGTNESVPTNITLGIDDIIRIVNKVVGDEVGGGKSDSPLGKGAGKLPAELGKMAKMDQVAKGAGKLPTDAGKSGKSEQAENPMMAKMEDTLKLLADQVQALTRQEEARDGKADGKGKGTPEGQGKDGQGKDGQGKGTPEPGSKGTADGKGKGSPDAQSKDGQSKDGQSKDGQNKGTPEGPKDSVADKLKEALGGMGKDAGSAGAPTADDDACLKQKWSGWGWSSSCKESIYYCKDKDWAAEIKSCCPETCGGGADGDKPKDSPAKDSSPGDASKASNSGGAKVLSGAPPKNPPGEGKEADASAKGDPKPDAKQPAAAKASADATAAKAGGPADPAAAIAAAAANIAKTDGKGKEAADPANVLSNVLDGKTTKEESPEKQKVLQDLVTDVLKNVPEGIDIKEVKVTGEGPDQKLEAHLVLPTVANAGKSGGKDGKALAKFELGKDTGKAGGKAGGNVGGNLGGKLGGKVDGKVGKDGQVTGKAGTGVPEPSTAGGPQMAGQTGGKGSGPAGKGSGGGKGKANAPGKGKGKGGGKGQQSGSGGQVVQTATANAGWHPINEGGSDGGSAGGSGAGGSGAGGPGAGGPGAGGVTPEPGSSGAPGAGGGGGGSGGKASQAGPHAGTANSIARYAANEAEKPMKQGMQGMVQVQQQVKQNDQQKGQQQQQWSQVAAEWRQFHQQQQPQRQVQQQQQEQQPPAPLQQQTAYQEPEQQQLSEQTQAQPSQQLLEEQQGEENELDQTELQGQQQPGGEELPDSPPPVEESSEQAVAEQPAATF